MAGSGVNRVETHFQHPKKTGLVIGRRVFGAEPTANCVRWADGIITGGGRAQELSRRLPSDAPVVELGDALITPGFIDGHTHFAQWALKRRRVDLTGAPSRDEAVRRVGAGAPTDGWVLGQGWDANSWNEPPTRAALDGVQSVPVCLDSLDVHAAWVNSAALELAGISSDTPDPPGGRIVRDAAGEPTGLLLENAVVLVRRVVPEPPPDLLADALLQAQREAHRLGVTGVHDVEELAVLDAFRRLEQEERLALRVLFHPPVAALPALIMDGVRSGTGSAWITSGGVKLFLDGSLGSRTAWMLEPYVGSRDRGMPLTSEEEAATALRLAAAHGISATVHAIGDAAVRRALGLLEPLPRAALHHRIEHYQCEHAAVVGSHGCVGIEGATPLFEMLVVIHLAERHWGRRGQGAYAFGTLAALGSQLAFGSDAPVAPLDPRPGVFAAMDRRAPGAGRDAAWY